MLAELAPEALAPAKAASGVRDSRISDITASNGRSDVAKPSSQKFIARNRAPRVQIEYDVELYGAQKKVQIPFVMGVHGGSVRRREGAAAGGGRAQVRRTSTSTTSTSA